MSVADVFGIHAPFLQIIYRSAIVFVAIVLGMRVTGARQLGQKTPFDLVLILLIANAVQNAMVGTDTTIFGGLAAAGTLLVANRGASFFADHLPFFRRTLEGQPRMLLHDGQLVESAIRAAGLSDDLVLQAIREHGFDSPAAVRTAVLEVDGTISIVPIDASVVRTRHRVRGIRPGGN